LLLHDGEAARLTDDDVVGISLDVLRPDRKVVGELAQELILLCAQQQMLRAGFIVALAVEFDLPGRRECSLVFPVRLAEETVVPSDPSPSRLAAHFLLPQRGLVVDDPVPLDGGTSVRVASSNSSGSPPVSPQTGQLHVVAQAGAEAVSTGMVDLAFQPRTFLMGQ
jgi:hypothetical protein